MSHERDPDRNERAEGAAPDVHGVPSEPAIPTWEEIERLRKEAAERGEYLEKLQRTAAEFANYQKRVQRERAESSRYAAQDFATAILGVLDNLVLAVRSAESSRDSAKLLEGVKLVERQFEKILSDNGVTPIDAEGKPFDPTLHEAIARQERNDVPSQTIVDVARRGYRLHDRVIRPAQVAIAMRKEPADGDARDGRSEDRKKPH